MHEAAQLQLLITQLLIKTECNIQM